MAVQQSVPLKPARGASAPRVAPCTGVENRALSATRTRTRRLGRALGDSDAHSATRIRLRPSRGSGCHHHQSVWPKRLDPLRSAARITSFSTRIHSESDSLYTFAHSYFRYTLPPAPPPRRTRPTRPRRPPPCRPPPPGCRCPVRANGGRRRPSRRCAAACRSARGCAPFSLRPSPPPPVCTPARRRRRRLGGMGRRRSRLGGMGRRRSPGSPIAAPPPPPRPPPPAEEEGERWQRAGAGRGRTRRRRRCS